MQVLRKKDGLRMWPSGIVLSHMCKALLPSLAPPEKKEVWKRAAAAASAISHVQGSAAILSTTRKERSVEEGSCCSV
jgi:hypothetical protein